jgi:hypothetical protein
MPEVGAAVLLPTAWKLFYALYRCIAVYVLAAAGQTVAVSLWIPCAPHLHSLSWSSMLHVMHVLYCTAFCVAAAAEAFPE